MQRGERKARHSAARWVLARASSRRIEWTALARCLQTALSHIEKDILEKGRDHMKTRDSNQLASIIYEVLLRSAFCFMAFLLE